MDTVSEVKNNNTDKTGTFVFNEQKMREAEVALNYLEQKVHQLEQQVQNDQHYDLDNLAETIAKRIDSKPLLLIPEIMQ